jgi:hypothetical protein
MSDAVIFETPGYLDLRAITTFGINAKPNSGSPIGFFGTGLKYAIAVLVREKQDITLHIGRKSYRFYTKDQDFRDKTFGFIYMDQLNTTLFKKPERLPFTTELGKTWKLWQAFRELYSNTLDENGFVSLVDDVVDPRSTICTRIIVRGGEFEQEYFDREKTFLQDALRERTDSSTVQIFVQPSNHIYYRGMRVMDLDKPARLTYNILTQLELTEDRTAKYSYWVESIIRDALTASTDAQIIELAVTAPKDSYEAKFNYDYSTSIPSPTFTGVIRNNVASAVPGAFEYVRKYCPTEEEEAAKEMPFNEQLAAHVRHAEWDVFLEKCQTRQQDVIKILLGAPF